MKQIKISRITSDFLPMIVGIISMEILINLGMKTNELSTWIIMLSIAVIYLIIRFKYIKVE